MRYAESSLLNTNGSCTNPVVSGDYFKGSALGSSNTVQLQAYVTTDGRFNLQTNSRNGFLFSATGSFSDTGIQIITLTATGKPDSAGDFIFTPALASSCSFSVSVTGEQVPQAGYTIAGAPNACSNVQVAGNYQRNHVLKGSNTITVSVMYSAPQIISSRQTPWTASVFMPPDGPNQTGSQTVT
jgi:hypothetical protein